MVTSSDFFIMFTTIANLHQSLQGRIICNSAIMYLNNNLTWLRISNFYLPVSRIIITKTHLITIWYYRYK